MAYFSLSEKRSENLHQNSILAWLLVREQLALSLANQRLNLVLGLIVATALLCVSIVSAACVLLTNLAVSFGKPSDAACKKAIA